MRWAAALAIALAAAPALAQEDLPLEEEETSEVQAPPSDPRMPIRGALRPITMPRNVFRLSAFMSGLHVDRAVSGSDFLFALQVGLAYSFTDDIEIGVGTEQIGVSAIGAGQFARSAWRPTGEGLLSFLVADGELDFGDIPVYGRYRFLSSELLEVGAELGLLIPTLTDFAVRLGVPVRLHLGEMFALDTGLYFSMVFGDDPASGAADDDFWGGLHVPIRGVVSPIDWLSFALSTGLNTGPFDGEFFAIPLGLEVIGSFPMGAESLLDMVVGFEWPALFRPATSNADKVEPSTWVLSAGARIYFAVGER